MCEALLLKVISSADFRAVFETLRDFERILPPVESPTLKP
jgi:hypothetical protein